MSERRWFVRIEGRAVPAPNGRLERLPRIQAWYQSVREAVRDATGIARGEFRNGRYRFAAPFVLERGQWAELRAWFVFRSKRSPDRAQLEKCLEDALFAEDAEVLHGDCWVRRGQAEDRVDVEVVIWS